MHMIDNLFAWATPLFEEIDLTLSCIKRYDRHS